MCLIEYRALKKKGTLSLKIVQYKLYTIKHTEEKWQKQKKRHCDLWDNNEQSNICALGVQGEKWQIEAEDFLKSEKIMSKVFFKFKYQHTEFNTLTKKLSKISKKHP